MHAKIQEDPQKNFKTFYIFFKFSRNDAQKSKPIHLEKGKLYELEATVKEYQGNDFIILATETPSGAFVAPIPSQRLFIGM